MATLGGPVVRHHDACDAIEDLGSRLVVGQPPVRRRGDVASMEGSESARRARPGANHLDARCLKELGREERRRRQNREHLQPGRHHPVQLGPRQLEHEVSFTDRPSVGRRHTALDRESGQHAGRRRAVNFESTAVLFEAVDAVASFPAVEAGVQRSRLQLPVLHRAPAVGLVDLVQLLHRGDDQGLHGRGGWRRVGHADPGYRTIPCKPNRETICGLSENGRSQRPFFGMLE
jgi:hypothetical protein